MVDYVLRSALENHSMVTIVYHKGSEITERNIRVLGMKNGNIEAYCYLRHQVRFFKKDNILAASINTR